MRDVLLSGSAGFLSSCAAAFVVHRALWKAADEQSKQLDTLVGQEETQASVVPKRKLKDSFEGFIVRRFSQWWNAGIDNIHGRLLGLPNTVDGIVEDVKGGSETKSSEQ